MYLAPICILSILHIDYLMWYQIQFNPTNIFILFFLHVLYQQHLPIKSIKRSCKWVLYNLFIFPSLIVFKMTSGSSFPLAVLRVLCKVKQRLALFFAGPVQCSHTIFSSILQRWHFLQRSHCPNYLTNYLLLWEILWRNVTDPSNKFEITVVSYSLLKSTQ